MLIKVGENLNFSSNNILSAKDALHDESIAKRFIKLAKKLKRIAPKANDFLYGHAIMMHAAEAALINQDTGEPILNNSGKPVEGAFETFVNNNGKESVRWISKDNIKCYRNANGDVFPEQELLKAYKNWVGKPLCKDHKSDSVDGIRGIIVDTYYDHKFKRVHALFALDRKNYSDLARKVETGYANAVSMGTAVGRSVCTECANVATTEREYCNCVRARSNYGEINLDLTPIELSLVVNGADGLAKIRQIVASLNDYTAKKQNRVNEILKNRCVNPTELQSLADSVSDVQKKINALLGIEKEAGDMGERAKMISVLQTQLDLTTDEQEKAEIKRKLMELINDGSEKVEQVNAWPPVEFNSQETPSSDIHDTAARINPGEGQRMASSSHNDSVLKAEINKLRNKTKSLEKIISSIQKSLSKEGGNQGDLESLLRPQVSVKASENEHNKVSKEENNMNSARLRARARARRAYFLGGGGINEPTPGKEKYPKEEADKIRDNEDKHMVGTQEMGTEGLYPGDEEKLRGAMRDGLNLSKAQLEERKMKRRAYWLGGGGINEPTPGKEKYPKEEADKIRDNEDKHMVGTYDMGGTDGMVPGDEKTKKMLLRAKLRARFTKVADESGKILKDASRWDVFAGDKLVLSATGKEIYGDELEDNWDYLSSKNYGKDVIRHVRDSGLGRVAYLLKGAQPPPADPMGMPPADPMAAPDAGAPPPPAPPVAEDKPAEPKEEDDDVKGKVETALGDMESAIEGIREAVSEGGEKLVDVEVKVDKGNEGAEVSPMDETLASRKEALLEAYALMNDSADELALISEALDKDLGKNKDQVVKAAKAALADSKLILAEVSTVIAKKEEDDEEDKKDKKDKKEDDKDKEDDADDGTVKTAKKGGPKCKKCGGKLVFGKCMGDCKKDKDDKDDEEEDEKDEKKEAKRLLDDALRVRAENRAALLAKAQGEEGKHCASCNMPKGECACAPADDADDFDAALDADCSDACGDVVESDESILVARKRAREELVAQASDKILGKYELGLDKAQNATEKTYFEAHPGGKGTVTELSHTKTDGARVETISEVHTVMRDVAESGPRNVREAAALIQEGIVKGAFSANDIDRLVSEGKVDSAAAAYWKKYFAQAPDAGSFGADLSKDFVSKKKEASDDVYKIKMRRAYDLGLEAQRKGFIEATTAALNTYVDEVMQLDDAQFESTKRIIAKMSPAIKKSAGVLPRVGADAATEAMNVSPSQKYASPSMADQLSSLGWK